MNTSHSGHRLKALLRSHAHAPSRFASDFGISNQTLNNWFVRGVPGKNLLAVSKYLGVRPEWLDGGQGDVFVSRIDENYQKLSESERAEADRSYFAWAQKDYAALSEADKERVDLTYAEAVQRPKSLLTTSGMRTHIFDYPEISWARAGTGVEAMNYSHFEKCDRYKSEVAAGASAFWLTVAGNSMTSATGVSFPEGYLILVAPDVEPNPGQFIVARLIASNEATFKQMVWDAGDFYLKSLNPAYPIKPLDDEWEIVGTVVDAKIPKSFFE